MRSRRFTNDDVESWMMSEGVDSIANYLRAGRIYEALSTEDLAKQYIDAIRAVTHAVGNQKCWRTLNHLCDEFTMRAEPRPHQAIAELENLYAAVNALIIAVSSHPEFGDDLVSNFTRFISDRGKGS